MYLEWRDVNGNVVQIGLNPDIEPITIGRNPGSTIYSKESTVSRNHGRIGYDEGEGYYIKDLGSSNGTFINNERTRRAIIREGDVVRCGEVLEIFAKPGGVPDPKRSTAALPMEDRPRQKPMPTGSVTREDQARLAAAVAAKQAAQNLVQSQADQVKAMADKVNAGPVSGLGGNTRRPTGQESALDLGRNSASPAPVRPAATSNPTGQREAVNLRPGGPGSNDPELQRKVVALERALAEAEARATKAENDLKSNDSRAMRYSVELEGLSEKYVKLKEHNQTIQRELEKTREELAKQTNETHEGDRRTSELESRLKDSEEKLGDATERLSGLKIRLNQKDRQIEELQHQFDQLQYEYRAAQEEIESLQVSFNREGDTSNRHEREKNLLREVIQEKESLIRDLKADLSAKDIEIRQIRMGVGISDLEHEKRRLLEDFHNATRRVDELNDRLMQQSRQIDTLRQELDAAKAAEKERKPVQVDVTEHPDFKAKVREIERMREEMGQLQRDLAKAELKLESAHGEVGHLKSMESELKDKKARTAELETKLREAESRINELITAHNDAIDRASQPKGVTISPQVLETLEALVDAVAASKSNATLVRRYAQQLEKHKNTIGEAGESVELMSDIAVVLAQDLSEQERMVQGLQRDLTAPG